MNDAPAPVADDTLLGDDFDVLAEVFRAAEKPEAEWRIGAESEKFGVDADTGEPLQYDGPRGVIRIFEALVDAHGWKVQSEVAGGPVISLSRSDASITLEPGAQFELSGSPRDSIHEICAEMRGHLEEIRAISEEMNLAWLGVGFHPLARQADLPWVPKQRYRIMRDYLPTKGDGALDMMRRTATVQANFDYGSEEDAMRKLRLALVVSPVIHAMTANAPFYEGRLAGKKSVRGDVWMRMDPDRSGLIPPLWSTPAERERDLRYRDYVEWALDAGMFLFKRDGGIVDNRGQSFRSFIRDGYEGHRAIFADWKHHLATLFPEARLKTTLEVRCADSLPQNMVCAVPALFTGLLYDGRATAEALALFDGVTLEQVQAARPAMIERGLDSELGGRSVRDLAERLLDVARGGLERRGRLTPGGNHEGIHLRRLAGLVERGQSPADLSTEGLSNDDEDLRARIIERTRV